MRRWLAVFVFVPLAVLAEEKPLKYPQTRKVDQVDDYHGTKVADPYRWLEDDVRKSKEVADWVEAENKVTARLPGEHPRARRDQEAADRAVELREILRPVQGTAAATSSARTTACRTRPCSTCRNSSTREPRMLLDPEHLDQGRHRRPGRHGGQRRRQATSPTARPRPAPTGTPGTCWTSPPASSSPTN